MCVGVLYIFAQIPDKNYVNQVRTYIPARFYPQQKTYPAHSTPPPTPTNAHHRHPISPGQLEIGLILFRIVTHNPGKPQIDGYSCCSLTTGQKPRKEDTS